MKKVILLSAVLAYGYLSMLGAEAGAIGSYTLSPEAGEVEEISSLKITFPDTGFMGLDYNVEFSAITLTRKDGTIYRATNGDVIDEYATFSFAADGDTSALIISDPGDYTLNIPEGTFKKFRAAANFNSEISVVYTIPAAEANSLTNYILDPAAGSVNSIDGINVKFPDTSIMGIDESSCEGVTLTRDGGTTYKVVKTKYTYEDNETMYFGTDANNPLTFYRPGKYVLDIPAGTYKAYRKDESNAKISATYEVVNPDFDSMQAFLTTPAPDTDLSEFKNFEIEFGDAEYGLAWPIDESKIYMDANINGGVSRYYPTEITMKAPYNKVSMGFSATEGGEAEVFTTTGNYTIVAEAGAFREDNNEYTNSEIRVPFTITNALDYKPFEEVECDPQNGSTVGELQIFNITFPNLSDDGLRWPIDASKITLQREGDENVYYGNSPMLSKGKTIILGFGVEDAIMLDQRTFRSAGKYTLTIPEGTLVDAGNAELSNPEIIMHFTVVPELNFTYKIDPDSNKVYSDLSNFTISGTEAITEVSINPENNENATLSNNDTSYTLSSEQNDKSVELLLDVDSNIIPGEWTLTIPAAYLKGMNEEGVEVVNPESIVVVYTVKAPAQFNFTTDPAQDAEISIFGKFTVSFEGKPKGVIANETAGTPLLKGNDEEFAMAYAISSNEISFAPAGGALLADGEYTVEIPEGFIETKDSDGLTASVPAISMNFKLKAPDWEPFDSGMLILNEGWFGHDNASLTHISSTGTPQYNAFVCVNPTRALGVTGQFASRYGNKLYVVSKQSGKNINGVLGGLLTEMDGETLAYTTQLNSLGTGIQARSFCAVSETKGYLSASDAIYPIDLNLMSAGDPIKGAESIKLQYGEMIFYRGKVFATAKDWDVLAIDPETDKFEGIDCGPVSTLFVTADGSLWAATLNESAEFVKIDPELLITEDIKVNAPEGVKTKIANNWTTWKAAPLAVDIEKNVVYYATEGSATQIGRLDLETREFTPDFVQLPATENGQTCLYGQGISVDPISGEIVITAIESGWGTHSLQNYILRADQNSGKILTDKTIKLSEKYWFPAMSLYCGYEAPEITLADFELEQKGAIDLILPNVTSLKMGNPYLINYDVESSDTEVCDVDRLAWGRYLLRTTGEGECTITVTAEFNGLVATKEVKASTADGVVSISKDTSIYGDVYTTSGIFVKTIRTASDLEDLPAGIYISNGKKIVRR